VRALALWLFLACSGGCSGSDTPSPRSPEPGGTAALTVELHGFRNDTGKALVGLYAGSRGFPRDRAAAITGRTASIADGRAVVRFESVPATRVALAALHDEDGDTVMKTGFFGQPKEGYGFSRDAPVRMGPPDFDDAAIDLADGDDKTIQIKIRY
jgi:uncharacterized protein (DUF2141 family)